MTDLRSLLSRGYFPIELPPPFSTHKFADVVHANQTSLPQEFSNPRATRLINHDIPRYGLYRRLLSIPNPITYHQLSKVVALNWIDISQEAHKSHYSYSKPINATKIRAIVPKYAIGAFPQEIMKTRANAKYILKTDISRCYASIYTHSIPWALHTKPTSKANRSSTQLLGNEIDKWIRYSQDGQTIGIPIGPDISLLISEVILSAVDEIIHSKLPRIKGYRYIDDYEFGLKTHDEANELLSVIRAALKEYELAVNEQKTGIIALPVPIEETWVAELRSFNIRNEPKKQKIDLIRYFDKSFDLVGQHPQEHILNYAIQRLRGEKIDSQNWGLVQSYLLQCVMVETGTLRSALFMLKEHFTQNYQIDKNSIDDVMNYQICHQSQNGYLSEIAWAVWALIYWGIPINSEATNAVSNISDSFIALLTLDAKSRGLVRGNLDTENWQKYMTLDELYGDQWLLSYEARIKGWLPSNDTSDHVKSSICFGFLQKHNVEFYDKANFDKLIEHERPMY